MSNIARFGQIALKTEDVSAVRGYALLFSDLNFSLSYGQFAAVKGPNGSGKTTFLRIVAGLAETETGTIKRLGLAAGQATPLDIRALDDLRDQVTAARR